MAGNFTLYNGVDTKAISVTNAASLFGFQTRGSLETSLNEIAWARGDNVDLVTPIGCTLYITATSEAAALTELRAIIAFAENAEYIRRTGQASWRALQGNGLSLLSFDPNVTPGGTSSQWTGQMTLLPMFALWTTAQINTLSAYETAVTAGETYAFISPGLVVETDSVSAHP